MTMKMVIMITGTQETVMAVKVYHENLNSYLLRYKRVKMRRFSGSCGLSSPFEKHPL